VSQDKPQVEPEKTPDQETADSPEPGPEETLDSLRAERDELAERVLRQAAEHENYKKRSEREKSEFFKRANQSMAADLLPVIDNLERALAAARENGGDQSMIDGLEMIHQELMRVLERHGLEPIEALGQPFDPEYHEAMMQQEDPDQPNNTVIDQVQKGYLFQDRLLRPAMVVVSKRPENQNDDNGDEVEIVVN